MDDVPRVDPPLLDRLREDLAPFTAGAVAQLLGPVAAAALQREQVAPALRELAQQGAFTHCPDTPVAVLVAAFLLGRAVPVAGLDAALPRLGAAGANRLGLVEVTDDLARPLLDLRPYAAVDAAGSAPWWIASDPPELATGGPLRTDHVLGIGGAGLTLARATIRRDVGAALDLGTGSGVQALHLRRHSRRVVATDISRRALAYARFNLALNEHAAVPGRPPVELRRGDLLDPVAGDRFDLVVSNPPFVITPRVPGVPAYEYRDGGLVGDELVERLVTAVGGVLSPGGVAQLLGNWEHRWGEPWQERVGAWLDAAGLDGWVVQREVQDPAEYAYLWVRDGGRRPASQEDDLVAAWLTDFEARGVDAVGLGMITLRRPASDESRPARPRLRRLEECTGPLGPALGEHLATCLDAMDLLAGLDDAALLAQRLRVAGDVTEERHHLPGAADPGVILLRQGGGFGRSVIASGDDGTLVAAVTGACDGDLPLGAIVAAVAELTELGQDGVRAAVLPVVRELVATALLLPVG